MELETLKGIYLGKREKSFKTLIKDVLKNGKLSQKYIDVLLSPSSLEQYASAFTSEMVDENNNYQVYEQLGDLSGNKFIVWYIYRRFPQLKCAEGVKVAARLRINYGAKNSFYKIAEEQGFWDFISATNDLRMRKKKDLLEDVFEAFIGCTESILDTEFCFGVGYACVYKILKSIFDKMDISLRYEDLYDAKTRLKELFDIYNDRLGPLQYEETKNDLLTTSIVYRLDGGAYEVRPDGSVNMNKITGRYRKVEIGRGTSSLKADAQQIAADFALKNLASQGYVKKPPSVYAKFSKDYEKNETTVENVLRLIEDHKNINEQFPTRGKSKYQNKYTSTVLAKYCRERDKTGIDIALKMGANPNIPDSEGLSAFDLLMIGQVRPKRIKKIMQKLLQVVKSLDIQKNVYDIYYTQYMDQDDWFKEQKANITIV